MADAYPNRIPITIATLAATVMATVDSTIVNVALPQIQGSLSASPEQITWVLTSYIVAMAISTPLSGWLSSRFGIRRVIMLAIAGFTLTSMLCGIAQSLPEMVLYRVLQGLFAAPLVPLSQAVILNINPPDRIARALSLWAAGVMLGPILGPLLGGWLTEHMSWRWCFFINLPVGLGAFAGVLVFMPPDAENRSRPFDFLGFGALATSIAALQLMMDRGPSVDWFGSGEVWTYAIVAGIAFWVFMIQSLTSRDPFFDPKLVRDRNLATSCVFAGAAALLLFSSMALLPNLMQGLMGYPPMEAGVMSVPRGFGTLVGILIGGRLASWIDVRLLLGLAIAASAAGMGVAAGFDLSMDTTPFIVSTTLQGFGTGLFFTPLNTVAFSTVAPTLRAEASSLFNLVRNLSNSAGIAILQAIVFASAQTNHAVLAARITPEDQMLRATLPPAFDPATVNGALMLDAEINRQSLMAGYVDAFRLLLILCFAFAPLLFLLRPPKRGALAKVEPVVD